MKEGIDPKYSKISKISKLSTKLKQNLKSQIFQKFQKFQKIILIDNNNTEIKTLDLCGSCISV